jgi:hypothetical protein
MKNFSGCLIPEYKKKVETLPCKNIIVCSNFITSNNNIYDGFCLDCHSLFGKWREKLSYPLLETKENQYCAICKENQQCVKRPYCNHYICIDAFRKLYYGYNKIKPFFPYNQEKENLYWKNIDNNIEEDWMINDEEIKKYVIQLNLYYNFEGKILNFTNSKCFECYP